MAMQSAELRAAQPSRSPSHSAKPETTAPILVAACLLAAVVALGLLGQPSPGESRAGADGDGAWIVGP